MKKIFFLLLIIVLLVIFVFARFGRDLLFKDQVELSGKDILFTAQTGSLAPDFIIKDVGGTQAPLSFFYTKKPVLLIFWSTWCQFCAQELPDLNLFNQTYQDKVIVIAVASGESKQIIEKYIQKNKVSFLISLDLERTAWKKYLAIGTPHHFLINQDGEILDNRPGRQTIDQLEAMLRRVLR